MSEQVGELLQQLDQKDQDLLLAAEYGNLLLQQHASMAEELGRCKAELTALKQSFDVTHRQNKTLRKNIQRMENIRKESDRATEAITVEKDGANQKLASEQLQRRNSLDQLESLQNRLDTSILAQEAMASENRKQRQVRSYVF
jgi:septal ring factor EnvC (AmiA/AmiB activator)